MVAFDQLNESSVICPHCWREFYSDEAWYISTHPDLYGDDVLEHENRRLAPHEVKSQDDGTVLDTKGSRIFERACPECHLQIPQELLRKRPKFISVVGAPRSGKTYFLTSMLHHLREDLARNFAYSLRDSDSHEVKLFLEYENTLFSSSDPNVPTLLEKTQEHGRLYNVVRLMGADIQLPKPIIFSLSPTSANRKVQKLGDKLQQAVVLYDNAGESYDFLKEKSSTVRVTQHLGHSEAVLFTFDPTQDPQTRVRLQTASADPQVTRAAVSYRQEGILTEAINRIRRHRKTAAGHTLPTMLLVCVQKYDVWKSLVPHATTKKPSGEVVENIDHTSVHFSASLGFGGLDVDEINRISLLVRTFLQDVNPGFVELAESSFSVVRYFPVSALGASPEIDETTAGTKEVGMLKIRPNRIKPFRVTHPLLWLMNRWKLIYSLKKSTAPTNCPHATVEIVENRMRVTIPTSRRTLMLDDEYSATEIIDPFSGARVWIPEIDRKQTPPAIPQVASPPIAPSLKLKVNEPPPKKGWFKKS